MDLSLSLTSIALGSDAAFAPDSLPDLVAWYRADSLVTPNGADASAWGDLKSPAINFAQATAEDQPLIVAADAGQGGKPSLGFDASNTEFMVAGAASDWTFLHNLFTVYVAFFSGTGTGNKTILDTANGTSVNVGFLMRQDGTNQRATVLVANGGASVVTVNTASSSCLNSARHILGFAYGEGVAPNEYELRLDGAATASGNSSANPAPGEPFGALTLGKLVGASAHFNGNIAEVIIYAARKTTEDMQRIEAYLNKRYA